MHLTEALLHSLRLEAETVEPNVVLGQAHIDVVGVVFFGSRQESLDYCSCADQAGLVVGVCCWGSLSAGTITILLSWL